MAKFVVRYRDRQANKWIDYQEYETREEAVKVAHGLTRQGNTCHVEYEDFTGREIINEFFPRQN